MVVAMDMAKCDPIVGSETQVALNQEDLVTTMVPSILQSIVQLIENQNQNSATPELTPNLHSTSLGKI